MKTTLTHLIIFGATLFLNSAFAIEYQSPRTLALGGAGRGGPLLNDAIYLNPSFASYTPVYSANAGYTWFNTGRNYNVSVQDSRDTFLQAGVGFTKHEGNSAVNIGASKQVINHLGFGLGSKILIDEGSNKLTTDMTFSTSYLTSQWLYASLIVDNILQSSEGKKRNLWRTVYLGTKFIPTKEVEFFVDPFYSPEYAAGNKAGVNFGVELGVLADFYLRFGKMIDGEISYLNTRGSGYGMGLGWIGPRINFDYALSRTTSTHSGLGQVTAHALTTTIFL